MKGWWVKMEIDEFTGHYIDKTDEEIVKDVRASVVDFIRRNPEGETFGAKMVRKMDDRIAERSEQNAINGKKGAEARWSRNSSKQEEARQNRRGGEGSLRLGGHVTPSRTCRPPRDFEEVKDFIAQNGLDYDDARLWWERNYVERDGIDKDGKPIKNWKGALVNACKAEETKRRSA